MRFDQEEYRRELREGLHRVFGYPVEHDMEKSRYVVKTDAGEVIELDEEKVAKVRHEILKRRLTRERYRMREKYNVGWTNYAAQASFEATEPPAPVTDELGLEPSKFKIRWWHRVIHWLWKQARKFL